MGVILPDFYQKFIEIPYVPIYYKLHLDGLLAVYTEYKWKFVLNRIYNRIPKNSL